MLKISHRLSTTIFLLIGCIVFLTSPAAAEDKRFYVGLGGSYQITNLDSEDVFDWDDNSWGVNAKFGYRLTPGVSFQFDIDYIPEIEGVYKPDHTVVEEVEVLTGIFSLKGYFPVSKPVKPFVIAGAGILHYDIDLNDEAMSLGYYLDDDDETSLCFKIGGGVDVFINESFSIDLEANYTAADDVEYYNFILGAAYHF